MPILPPAPGRFSTTNCWPTRSDNHWPIRRAATSVVPAGANGTTMRTGRDGYACAQAKRETAGRAITPPAARVKKVLREGFMALLLRAAQDTTECILWAERRQLNRAHCPTVVLGCAGRQGQMSRVAAGCGALWPQPSPASRARTIAS